MEQLRSKLTLQQLLDILTNLKVSLKTHTISWVISFKESNGMSALMDVLKMARSAEAVRRGPSAAPPAPRTRLTRVDGA